MENIWPLHPNTRLLKASCFWSCRLNSFFFCSSRSLSLQGKAYTVVWEFCVLDLVVLICVTIKTVLHFRGCDCVRGYVMMWISQSQQNRICQIWRFLQNISRKAQAPIPKGKKSILKKQGFKVTPGNRGTRRQPLLQKAAWQPTVLILVMSKF